MHSWATSMSMLITPFSSLSVVKNASSIALSAVLASPSEYAIM